MTSTADVAAALAERGAATIDHPGGTLLDHLVRTSEMLASWGARVELVLAGVAHAAYGTDGFDVALYGLDERAHVAGLIGSAAEEIVYRYASCGRRQTLGGLGAHGPVRFHDRFTGRVETVDEAAAADFAELTFANELDLFSHSSAFRAEHGPAITALFDAWEHRVSPAAYDAFTELRHLTRLVELTGVAVDELALPRDRFTATGEVRLHYLDWGTAGHPVVVLLHGGGLSAYTWNAVALDLRRDHHCYAVDLRGHGDSDWSETLDYSVDAHTRDLEAFVDHLSEPVVLVGHSLGGFASIRYASRHPDRVVALVIVDVGPFVRNEAAVARLRDFVRGPSDFASIDDAVDHALTFSPDRDPTLLRHSLRRAMRQREDGRWTWKRDQRPLDDAYFADRIADARSLIPDVSAIRCPTLVVRGQNSDGLSADEASDFVALLGDGRMATVGAAGHNVQSDNPAGLLSVVRPFLAETRWTDGGASQAARRAAPAP